MSHTNLLFLSSTVLIALFGCSGHTNSQPVIPLVSEPEAAAIETLRTAGATIKTDQGGSATEVSFQQLDPSPESLELLASLKSLRSLNLADSSFSDASLSALDGVSPLLVSLDLRGCQLSNKATTSIARFTALRVLRFSGKNGKTSIDDDGIKALAACNSLKVLALDDLTFVGTVGLESLAGLPDLLELYMAGTIVDDASCHFIASLRKLKKLRLARTQVGDPGLEALSECSTLEDLDLSENSLITDAGMAHLAKLSALRKLNLWRVQITDSGILMLAPLTKMEWLNLDNTRLSDAGLPVLTDMNALTFLHLGSTQITEAGASSLFHLKNLKDLKLTRTAMASSDTAVVDLKNNLPSTVIQTEYVEAE